MNIIVIMVLVVEGELVATRLLYENKSIEEVLAEVSNIVDTNINYEISAIKFSTTTITNLEFDSMTELEKEDKFRL